MKQLQIAQAVGFTFPRTTITNDLNTLQQFAEVVNAPVVLKKLRSHCLIAKERAALFVTRKLDDIAEVSAQQLKYCPVIAQVCVDKVRDARIVVIGNRVFAVSIRPLNGAENSVDYRAAQATFGKAQYEAYQPPDPIAQQCIDMLRLFKLQFGAFDFAIKPNGDHVFLELNPNGQWLWVQLATGLDLVSAMTDLLAHPSRTSLN